MSWNSVADYVRSLDLDAWLVGGAVRDELLGKPLRDTDFVVPGVGHAELKAALEPHGRVEDLVVADRRVGIRLHPRDPAARALAPAGIEFAPPRVERSTGPGRHDFEIVADASISLERDMQRRDFTINAMARRLADGTLLDPLGGEEDLERRVLRATGPTSFRDDPLRIVRGLRFVSELDLDPEEQTLRQLREWSPQLGLVAGERIGGGLAADGLGELSKLLLGANPQKALRLARDSGALVAIVPEYERAIGFEQESRHHGLPLDEHHFAAVQAGADAGAPLGVRLALLLHDLGKPQAAWRGDGGRLHYYANPELGKRAHEDIGTDIAGRTLVRLRYPNELRAHVRRIVSHHGFTPPQRDDPARARRFLRRHGVRLARDLVAHKEADLVAKGRPVDHDLARLTRFGRLLVAEQTSPHQVRDLAVGGDDLLMLGYREGPAVGRTLETLLDEVVENPFHNTREWLIERARELLVA
ncbi:MAG: CCA tRNA nucleotidyltransferase [Gaiellaceae bacterium]